MLAAYLFSVLFFRCSICSINPQFVSKIFLLIVSISLILLLFGFFVCDGHCIIAVRLVRFLSPAHFVLFLTLVDVFLCLFQSSPSAVRESVPFDLQFPLVPTFAQFPISHLYHLFLALPVPSALGLSETPSLVDCTPILYAFSII